LTLAEAKTLLARLQEQLIRQQADEYVTCRRVCPRCYRMQPVKDYKYRPVDTLFGTVRVRSPRWLLCGCHRLGQVPFSPLNEIIPRRCTPELEYLLARFASLMPYRQVVRLLQEFFPLSPTLNHATARNRTLRVAQRLEADLAAEMPAEPVRPVPREQPVPAAASEPAAANAQGILICMDTGFVRSCDSGGARHFELTVGRCERPDGSGECFGFVADPEVDPIGKARWPVLLARQGHQPGQPLTVISDGADAFVALAQRLGATHILDWFHVAMRFERLHQIPVKNVRHTRARPGGFTRPVKTGGNQGSDPCPGKRFSRKLVGSRPCVAPRHQGRDGIKPNVAEALSSSLRLLLVSLSCGCFTLKG
jgi:hypothetical protein